MAYESALGALSRLSTRSLGVFRGRAAVEARVTRKQLAALQSAGVVERMLPDTYRLTAVAKSHEQELRAALLWAGAEAAAAGRSAGELYRLEGVTAATPEIVVPASSRVRCENVVVHRADQRAALMVRQLRGLSVTGVETTLVSLAACLDAEAFEIACEDARRRQLTSVSALRAHLARFGRAGRVGVSPTRRLLRELDPDHPSRSTLEVKTRRLLVANDIDDFVREFPLVWNRHTYAYDFGFPRQRTISRRTVGAGTTIPPTTNTTTRSGASPAATDTASCLQPGTRSHVAGAVAARARGDHGGLSHQERNGKTARQRASTRGVATPLRNTE